MAAPSATRVSLAVAFAALSLALAPTVLAQAPGGTIALKLDQSTLSLGAANNTTLTGTVAYADQVPAGTATITVSATAPDGWKAEIKPPTLNLAPGASGTFTITLTAPAAHTGAATGALGVKTDAAYGPGPRTGSSATASVQLTRVDPIPPPPTDYTPYYVGAAAAVLLVAAAIVFIMYRRRKAAQAAAAAAAAHAAYMARETGINITVVDGPLPFGERRELIYRVNVQNVSDRERTAVIEVRDLPENWRAAPSIPKAPLQPGEKLTVSVYVNPSDVVPTGDAARILITSRPEEAQERFESVTLDLSAPPVRVPPPSGAKHAVQAREGVTNRSRLRR